MTLHADARSTLAAWVAPDAEQAALQRRYLDHLDEHADGLTRECRPDHITASTLVMSHDRTHVLLTLHAKAERWFQFGGHPEAHDVTLVGAALREATEESGLHELRMHPRPVHLDEHAVPFCGPGGPDSPVVVHLDVRFLAVAPASAEPVVSEESLDVGWWPVDALPNPDLVSLVAAAQSALSNSEGGVIREASDHPSR